VSAPVELLDAVGLCRIARRTADLDGSVPLRAARACVPLLEGNAFGRQIELRRSLRLRRRLGGWQLVDDDEWQRSVRAAALLLSDRIASATWRSLLADGPLVPLRGGAGPALGLWTGLLARTRPDRTLWVGSAGNRRNRDVLVHEHVVEAHDDWVPLVLELRPADDVRELELRGEIATLAALPRTVPVRRVALADAPDIGRAHCEFYDAQYFAAKQAGPTRKYRRMLAEPGTADVDVARLVEIGPPTVTLEPFARRHDARGPREPFGGDGPTTLVFRNPVDFEARFDGLHVRIDHDTDRLAAIARAIEAELRDALGPLEHRGALLYLTKYFTPHVPGEPHFFVKPAAWLATPPGIATLVEGQPGAGYDVLRGVVRTDRFFALPAVFALWQPGRTIAVPAGTPLWRAMPFQLTDDAAAPHLHEPLAIAAR